ncbi:TonB-dependent receptor plug domain-containing protein [Paucibacter sp. Y2R2-4]|uniref:TonB-dependent receptor plug domain-containing protein n=1 Tax=Paucibacter sp. Y2R2-4 TaxID=2893553 RepID=UPI0021E460F4|nr:TonB-dependent receptor [Paucibacter sp. Y2R2-4]MCV2349106.1 TonB-dependent receptor [Paucibacter sp. Y2R2-4]
MRPILVGIGLCLWGCSALAQGTAVTSAPPDVELGLEELLRQPLKQVPRDVEVSTASRFSQSAAQAPSTTYVLTAEDIARHGFRSMADILRAMPGLYVTKGSSFNYIGARGLGRPGDLNTRLLFLIDGMRINENVYDAAQIGEEFFLDIDLIDRVEFAPGPGSALYGNNAFLGVVNVLTKRADTLGGLQIRTGLDSQGLQQLRASWGYRSEAGWEGWLSASGARQDERPLPYAVPSEFEKDIRERLWDRSKRLTGSFNAGAWALRFGATDLTQGVPSALEGSEEDVLSQAYLLYYNRFISLSHERSLGPDWDLFASVSAKSHTYRERYPFLDPVTHQQRFFGATSLGRWTNWDLRLSTRQFERHVLMAGLEVQDDREQRILLGDEGDPPIQEYYGVNRRTAWFIQDEWQLSESQRLIFGLRRDASNVAKARLNPRLAWVWSGIPDATLRLMYGSAFRAANLNEFAVNASWEAPTPKPEQIKSFELAWEQSLTSQLQYRASLYASRLTDLIDQNQVDLPIYENNASMRTYGAELDVERRWDQGARLRLGLSLQRSKDANGAPLSNSPRSLFKLLYSQPLLGDALQVAWQSFAMSRRDTPAQSLPGYAVHNLNLLWRPSLDWEFSLGVYNLTDHAYVDRPRTSEPEVRQERRTLQLGLSWRMGR